MQVVHALNIDHEATTMRLRPLHKRRLETARQSILVRNRASSIWFSRQSNLLSEAMIGKPHNQHPNPPMQHPPLAKVLVGRHSHYETARHTSSRDAEL
jgi:1,2-phenylacetyl-CoA epoxidase PaaB subunit